MKVIYNITGDKRKELVKAIGTELQAKLKYCGAPSFAYEVDGLTISRDGAVSGEDNRGLIADLEGCYGFVPASKEYDIEMRVASDACVEPRYTDEEFGLGVHRCDPIGENGMQASDAPEDVYGLSVSLPRDGISDETLANIRRIINGKASLIKKALGLSELPVEAEDGAIFFPWYNEAPSGDVVSVVTMLVSRIVSMAKTQKRVIEKDEKPVENEKYAFRCFLLRLGFIGDEYKAARHLLLQNFTGSSAFRTGERRMIRPEQPIQSSEEAVCNE